MAKSMVIVWEGLFAVHYLALIDNSDASQYWRPALWCLLAIILVGLPLWSVTDESMLLSREQFQNLTRQYGTEAGQRLRNWQQLIHEHRHSTDDIKLQVVNDFFNQMDFVDDQTLWGQQDYWATPFEFLGQQAGDCEDFSIAKYFTLREMGIPIERMRLAYVKAVRINQAHMVLSYYPDAHAEPVILDNLDTQIKKAGQRPDLIPAYSFNGDYLWKAKVFSGYGTVLGKSKHFGLWQKLIHRINNH